MSLFITSLNSGSNGNCYYIGNEEEAILVDAGISCRETERRMKRLDLPMQRLKAIFISHEHNDHINGVAVLSKKYQLPVYITTRTEKFCSFELDKKLVKRFKAGKPVTIGRLQVSAFQKEHDAEDPHSFIVSSGVVKIGVFTDIGIACEQVVNHFRQCHAAFLEANYDRDMLMQGNYPWPLKKRITDGKGHLSNSQALELFTHYRAPFLSHLVLSHLSHNNNSPELVDDLFRQHAGNTTIVVASRNKETGIFSITGDYMDSSARPAPPSLPFKPKQLSLFQ